MTNLSLNANNPPAHIHGHQNTYHHNQDPVKMGAPPMNGTFVQPATNAPLIQPPFSGSQSYYAPGRLSTPGYGGHQPAPLPGSMTPPVGPVHNYHPHHLPHASSMPNLQQHFQGDANGAMPNPQGSPAPLFNVNAPFQTVATVGEPSKASSTSSSHFGRPLFDMNSQSNPIDGTSKPLGSISNPPAAVVGSDHALMNKTMPALSTIDDIDASHHVRSNSMPDFKPLLDGSSMPGTLAAPPTHGYYTRSLSPNPPIQRTPSPTQREGAITNDTTYKAITDSGVYHNVMDQLNFALDKCSTKLDTKLYDDIKRKLDILEHQWNSENLLKEVKDRMVKLAEGKLFCLILSLTCIGDCK